MSARSYDLKRRRQGNITIENCDGLKTQVILHRTCVVDYSPVSGRVTLNSGGWQTVTTKTAINRFFDLMGLRHRYGISQSKGVWYLHDGMETAEFFDGMTLYVPSLAMGVAS